MAYCAYCGAQVSEVSYKPCPSCGNPSNGAPRPQLGTGGSNAALIAIAVVVGGLVVVAIIGILAAIAIPNILTAMQRSKQKRTMADMRIVATAVETYATQKAAYPASLDQVGDLPKNDGWANGLRYECWPKERCTNYAIASAGKDGKFEHATAQEYPGGATARFDCDILFADGKFVQYPEGVQH